MRPASLLFRGCALFFLLGLASWSCSQNSEDENTSRPIKKNKGGSGGVSNTAGEGGASSGGVGSSGGENPFPLGGQSGTSGGVTGQGGQPPSNGLPCEVSALFQNRCQPCHADPTQGGPMPLVDRADLLKTNAQGVTLAQRSLERIQNINTPMPPKPKEGASAEEIAALKSWIDLGTPEVTCGGGEGGAGSTAGAAGSGDGGSPFGGAGGALPESCKSLGACCETIGPAQNPECQESLSNALKESDSSGACSYTLGKLQKIGKCTGATGAIPSEERCGLFTTSDSCNDCFDAFCCDEAFVCKNNPENANCATALACLSQCPPGNGACQSNCLIKFSEGEQIFLDVLHCIQLACKNQCSSGSGGAGGSGGTGGASCLDINQPCVPGQSTCCDGGVCSEFGVCTPCAGEGASCFFGSPCCKGECSQDTGTCPSCLPTGSFCLFGGGFCCDGECDPFQGVCMPTASGGSGGSAGNAGSAGSGGSGACIKDLAACSPAGLPCCSGPCDSNSLQCPKAP